jgi:hypothetical protein
MQIETVFLLGFHSHVTSHNLIITDALLYFIASQEYFVSRYQAGNQILDYQLCFCLDPFFPQFESAKKWLRFL